ncbi:MAG: type 2 lantipeptide synthetase LanM, partial [Chloroflexi bacterium]|nr:type 2 lantipeptide synthetase LanM [Chloroflexota bacterium]
MPDWYRAMTLQERVASWASGGPQPAAGFDADLADYRWQRWLAQEPFGQDDYFGRRLALDGVTEEDFRYLLGEPASAIRSRFAEPPGWLVQLKEAFSAAKAESGRTVFAPPQQPAGQDMAGFLSLAEPLIRQGQEQLHREVLALSRQFSILPFEPEAVEAALLADLPERLLLTMVRTLVLELNVSRLQGQLPGDTPQERFQSFLARLGQRDITLAILQESPVLARQLVTGINRWVAFSQEFLLHLGQDWQAICKRFGPENDPGMLIETRAGAGDVHRGGRSVVVARFDSGLQLVYKPRSLAVDVHFQELLEWLNHRGEHQPFRTLKVLDQGSYGWVEFVPAQSCHSPEEVTHFYERQGGYLALLYALEATDFHSENLIALGEHPVLIDLESLLHPRAGPKQVGSLAAQKMAHSVLRVGLLPQLVWSNEVSEGVDLSGLGAAPGQLTPAAVPGWDGVGTDNMRFVRQRVEMPGARNRPQLNGAEVRTLDYAEAIKTGFRKVYQLLMASREELL